MNTFLIGVDLGGTKCAITLGDAQSHIWQKESFPTGIDTPADVITSEIISTTKRLLLAHPDKKPSAIGISCGGPLDSTAGILQSPPNLPLFDDYPIVDLLQKAFDLPVFLQNDANACALAEWRFGAGEQCQNMIFLTFGTGLGAGLILDGKLYEGTNGMAGEVGHIELAKQGPIGYGKIGSFEGFCSGGGIARLAKMRATSQGVTDYPKTAKELAHCARAGDAFSLSILEESAHYLGMGLSILIDILNPQKIVIGSIYARCEDLYRNQVLDIITKQALPHNASVCQIVPAALGESIGDIAAISVAMQGLV